MTEDKTKAEQEKKPDENLDGSAAAHLVIRDKKTDKVIYDGRG